MYTRKTLVQTGHTQRVGEILSTTPRVNLRTTDTGLSSYVWKPFKEFHKDAGGINFVRLPVC